MSILTKLIHPSNNVIRTEFVVLLYSSNSPLEYVLHSSRAVSPCGVASIVKLPSPKT